MEVSFDNMDRVTERFQAVLDKFPDGRRRVAEKIAAALTTSVQAQIGGAGKVKRWQTSAVGTKGGYAAVRPGKGKTGRYSIGYVTVAIDQGHRTRKPTGKSKRYRPRITTPRVPGREFYAAAGVGADKAAWAAAEALMDELAGEGEK